MNLCGIYLLIHIETGRKYVGQSVNIKERIRAHSKVKRDTHISNAVAAHGWNAFATEILELCDTQELDQAEAKWIAFYRCMTPHGFNMTSGGELRIPTAEARAKMSAAKKGKQMHEKTRAALAAVHNGRKRTEESKQKTAAALKGRQFSQETILKMSAAAKLRCTPEHQAKMQAGQNAKRLLRQNAAIATAGDLLA
jgi:group I intron endonuclease